MTMREQWLAVRNGWKIVAACVVLGLLAGLAQSLLAEPSYVSSTRLFVAAEADSEDPDELYYRNQIAAARINSYVELVQSDAVAMAAAEVLRTKATVEDLAGSVAASTIPNTVLLDIQARADTPTQARELAAAYAEVLPEVIADLETVGDDRAAQVKVSTVNQAAPAEPANPGTARTVGLGALLGLVVGVGAAIVVGAVRRERSTEA